MLRKGRHVVQNGISSELQRISSLREQGKFTEAAAAAQRVSTAELEAGGISLHVVLGEARLSEDFAEEAEHCLRQALAAETGAEEARSLLGRLLFQRGNPQGALAELEPLSAQKLLSLCEKITEEKSQLKKKAAKREATAVPASPHAVGLMAEALLIRAKCLQKLGKLQEAVAACRCLLDALGTAFPQGMAPESWANAQLRAAASEALQLLPDLHRAAGQPEAAVEAYRWSLKGPLGLNGDVRSAVEKEFALYLMYGEAHSADSSMVKHAISSSEGSVNALAGEDKANLQEAAELLLRLQRTNWDPQVMEHLALALTSTGQFDLLVKQYEEVLPGVISRTDRWYKLALSHHLAGRPEVALDCLRKALQPAERPNDVPSLLLACKVCSQTVDLAQEGIVYGRRVVENATDSGVRGKALHSLGVNLATRSRGPVSDSERSGLRSQAVGALREALELGAGDPSIKFDLALTYAQQHNISPALKLAKELLRAEGPSNLDAARLVALLLSAQQRYREAEDICNAALEAGGKAGQGGDRDAFGRLALLRVRGKVQLAAGQPNMALDSCKRQLSILRMGQKGMSTAEKEEEVWGDVAEVYVALQQWADAEACVRKALALGPFSASAWHAAGLVEAARGNQEEALASYQNSLAIDPSHVPSMVSLGALYQQERGLALPVARSYLTDALHLDPTNHVAWYTLGLVHEADRRMKQAADCFEAALALQDTSPVLPFSSISWAL